MPETTARHPQLQESLPEKSEAARLKDWTDSNRYRIRLAAFKSDEPEMQARARAIHARITVLGIAKKMFISKTEKVGDSSFRGHLDRVLELLTKPPVVNESTFNRVDDYLAKNGFQVRVQGVPASFFGKPESREMYLKNIAAFRNYIAQNDSHLKLFADWASEDPDKL